MRIPFLAAALAFLAGCDSTPARQVPRERPEPVAGTPRPEPDVSGPFSSEEENELYSFAFAWPAVASAIPALEARLRQRLERMRSDTLGAAEAAKAEAAQMEFPFRPHHYSESWSMLGDSGRLLSLAAEIATYSGGAHGNTRYEGLLWDRQANREIETEALFEGGLAPFGGRFCAALDRARAERRGEPVRSSAGDDFMTGCPALAERVVLPADADADGRLDSLRVLIPPYVAGPYAEGPYEISLDLTPADVERIAPEHRPAFEA